MSTKQRLRVSGILATLVFLVMVISDLLMLTTLDFGRPYRGFWNDSPGLPQAQATWGFFVGELTVPFYCVAAWHLSLAVRPAGRWASWVVLVATAYSASLLTVWHASFAFTRSILRVETLARGLAGGPAPEAALAFQTYAVPLFRVVIGVAGVAFLVVHVLMAMGKTLYPRWACLALPALLVLIPLLQPYVPVWATVVLGAGYWNVAGALLFGASTLVLWDRVPPNKPQGQPFGQR